MQIVMLAIGTRMPVWIRQGFEQYALRMPNESRLVLKEVVSKAGKSDSPGKRMDQEYQSLLNAQPANSLQVALDRRGQQWDTERLSRELDDWRHSGRDVSLIIGGADGLPQQAVSSSNSCWSLSRLTLPHMLVRVIVAEQLYRAHTMLHNHPYHRK